ncbi:MAG: proline dehydrogenase family protein [SAR324 cluster bacterium]|nr:proline dehydrogenase family protein [SAR324 cluster bacterium]
MKPIDLSLEAKIQTLAQKLWAATLEKAPGLFDQDYWQGRLLNLVMKDPAFKVDFFRFIDVLPILTRSKDFTEHIEEYLLKPHHQLPRFIELALQASTFKLMAPFASKTIKSKVSDLAMGFILTDQMDQVPEKLLELNHAGLGYTVDLLGEATLSKEEATGYQKKYLDLVDQIAEATRRQPAKGRLSEWVQGLGNMSIKVTAFAPYLEAADLGGNLDRLEEMLLPVFLKAKKQGIFVNLDLEQWQYHQLTYQLFARLALHPELQDYPKIGVVAQAYLLSIKEDLHFLLDLAQKRGTPFSIRLVKGAYWDYEVINAQSHGLPVPVFLQKPQTDLAYEQASQFILEHYQLLRPAFASHNLRSLAFVLAMATELEIPNSEFEIQMLYGMAEPTRMALIDQGYSVRLYTPVGDLLPGMSYLVRRLLENTSNEGFLRQSYQEHAPLESLVQNPKDLIQPVRDSASATSTFSNCPELDFSLLQVTKKYQEALDEVLKTLPAKVPGVISGERFYPRNSKLTKSPNDPQLVVAELHPLEINEAELAVGEAEGAWPSWSTSEVAKRADYLDRLADILEEKRYFFCALETVEVGKPWPEADGDVAEAIDFCRYYAQVARETLEPESLGQLDGEENTLYHEGRGPAAIIAPWNFPLAILCGMTTAALVAGNPVLIKPSSNASLTGYHFFLALEEAGFPKEVIHFLPGEGSSFGGYLVDHIAVPLVAFTGSKAVGLKILERAGQVKEGQKLIKKVVCEMGGKNAIIVDADADMDLAVVGVIQSAFGFAGQKCSAASRIILVGDAKTLFLPRLLESVASMPVAPATSPNCRLGPVIDQVAFDRLKAVEKNLTHEAKLLFKGSVPEGGFYIAPQIYQVTDRQHPLLQKELFGPITTVICCPDFNAALDVAMDSEYFLTGAIYSRNPAHLSLGRQRFKVGNLYLNQGSTGAKVERQPFGGFGMSGTGTKAAGRDYLKNFTHPRVVTENLTRRGFSPTLLL